MRKFRLNISLVFLAIYFLTLFHAQRSLAAAILRETFDEMAKKDQIHLEGGAEVVAELHGTLLRLPDRSYARLSLSRDLSARAGTVMFWVRPLWTPTDHQSHIFLSGRWGDGQQGYFAISYGWWEPVGEGRIYFIVNNEEMIHCSERYRFEPEVWTRLTVSWKSGPHGSCRIFIDGAKIAEYAAPFPGDYKLSSPIYLGSDLGATDQRDRFSNFEVDDLQIYDYEMSDSFIISLDRKKYLQRMGKPLAGGEWMEPDLNQAATAYRDQEGILRETRVLFDEDIHWAYSAEAANRILKRVKAAGFNVYIPCVWHGRGAHFPTAVVLPDERLASLFTTGYDPLQYLIKRAHQLGIEVHPWFTVIRRDWSRYPEYFSDGTPENAYDVHHSDFREFILRLMLDTVKRYDVDGINLDYIRAMGVCTSAECQKEYEKETGYHLLDDLDNRFVAGKARDRIESWQDAAVAEIVRLFSERARRIKPGLIITANGNPVPHKGFRPLEGRDELRWMENGWVDATFNMDYRVRIDYETIDQTRKELPDPGRIYPLFGNFDLLDGKQVSRSGEMIKRYVQFSRVKWPESGIGFYIFHMLSDEQIAMLRKSVFAESAKPLWPGLKPWPESACHPGKECGTGSPGPVTKGR